MKYTLYWVNKDGEEISSSHHEDLGSLEEKLNLCNDMQFYKHLKPKTRPYDE